MGGGGTGRVAIDSKERNPLGCSALAQVGHTYLNVIDIEAGDLQEVPVREPSDEDMLPQAEGPSSAALHHLAATVTSAAPLRRVKSQGSFPTALFTLLTSPGSPGNHCILDVYIRAQK